MDDSGNITIMGVSDGTAKIKLSVEIRGVLLASDECTVTVGHRAGTKWKTNSVEHWKECTECKERTGIEKHTFQWVVDKKATASQKGSRHQECTTCKYKKASVEIPKTGGKRPTYQKTSVRKIKVSWWRKKAADGFVIYAKAGNGKYKKIKTVGKQKSATVTVKSGYSYKFKVKAYKNETKNGKTVRKYWKAYKASGKNGKKTVKAVYKNVSGYKGYAVYVKVGKGSYKKVKTTSKGGTITYTNKNAKVGKKYTFKLKGYKIVKGKKVYTTIKTKRV